MTDMHKFHYSMVQFRETPTDEISQRRNLGILLGFTTQRFWVVGLALRSGVSRDLVEGLDALSAELIEHRSDVLQAEINAAFDGTRSPEAALRLIAERNQWSLWVTPPKVIEIDMAQQPDVSVDKITDYVWTIYSRELERTHEWLEGAQGRDIAGIAHDGPRERAPAAWVIGSPQAWLQPVLA